LQLAFGSKSEEESGLKAWAIILIVLGKFIGFNLKAALFSCQP
jgi:hypothetical protein